MALAGHLHDAELRDREDVVLRLIGRHELDHLLVDRVAVTPLLHVDEVHHEQAAEIAEPDLARDFGRGLEVHGVDDVLLFAAAVLVRTGVHVDRDQRFGLVDDDFAAARERDLALAGLLDLALDVEALEDRDAVFVEGDLARGTLRDLGDELLGALVVVLAVDQHAVDILGEEVADGAFDDIGFLIQAGRGAVALHLGLNVFPGLEEDVEIADEVAGLLALAGGADDDTDALGEGELVDQGLEPLALGEVLDLTRDAATVTERREDEVTARDRKIGRGPRALGADGALGDLDDDLAAGRVHLGDVLDRGFGGAGRGVLLLVHADDLDGRVGGGGQHVPVVEKRVLGVTDVDERGLEARIEILDPALVDAADHPVVGLALDLEFLEPAVDEQGDPLFQRLGIDDQLPIGALILLENGENLLEDRSVLGTFVSAGLELGVIDLNGFRRGRRIDEFFVVFLGDVRRDGGVWLG